MREFPIFGNAHKPEKNGNFFPLKLFLWSWTSLSLEFQLFQGISAGFFWDFFLWNHPQNSQLYIKVTTIIPENSKGFQYPRKEETSLFISPNSR